MKREIVISYNWWCHEIDGEMPGNLVQILEEKTQDRIIEMLREGYTSGELHDYEKTDIEAMETPEDGWECHGWFSIDTKCL